MRTALGAPLVCVCVASCASSPTYVLVTVATDLPGAQVTLTAQVDRALASTDPMAPARWSDRFTLVRLLDPVDGLSELGAFTVLPRRGAPTEPVNLDLLVSDGTVSLRRRARIAFVVGRALQFRVVLRARCATLTTGCETVSAAECTIAQRCEERMQTCGDDAQCVTPMVQPSPLVEPPARTDGGRCPDPALCVAAECQIPVARCEGARTVCGAGSAPAGQPCAAGVCDGLGRCGACGGLAERCCGQSCRAGLLCVSGRCDPCGGRGQPCCGVACAGGLDCAGGRCIPCGSLGERCCAGVFCNGGASCATDSVCR